MEYKAGKKRKKGTGLRQRLLVILMISLLFLVCIMLDCWKKGLFSGTVKRKGNPIQRENVGEETEKNRDNRQIRVLLSNSEQTSIFHEEISITGTGEFTVRKEGEEKSYQAGKKVTFQRKDVKAAKGGIVFSCATGKLRVISIRRRQRIPAYQGTLKLTWNSRGILLVNALPLRQYLYGVLPSEMSPEYPMEALKAQAVCARSFAWRQMKAKTYKKYGADVDDTTAYQVYNMAGEDPRTRKAVKKTAGEMLFHGKNVITTYYYSTSWGCSATTEEVWGGGEDTECYPRRLQITEESSKTTRLTKLDLSDEKLFQSFMTDSLCDTYDGDSGWYRWRVMVSAEELGARMGIGKVKKIQVLQRGKSGLLGKIRVVGTNGRRTITGQQDIREKLMVSGSLVEKKDGSRTELSMLPSAAFLIQAGISQGEEAFWFIGGGFGHGTGMSQNGAAGMAKMGCSYKEILMHYYSKCEIN